MSPHVPIICPLIPEKENLLARAFTGTTVPLRSFIFYKSFSVPSFAATCIRERARRVRTDPSQELLPVRLRDTERASELISDAGAKSRPSLVLVLVCLCDGMEEHSGRV